MYISQNLLLLAGIAPNLVIPSPVPYTDRSSTDVAVPRSMHPVQVIRSLATNPTSQVTAEPGNGSQAEETDDDSDNRDDPNADSDGESIDTDSRGSQAARGGGSAHALSSSKDAKPHVSSSLADAAPAAPAAAAAAASASTPHFAIYAIDGVPPASSLKGVFNVLILAFLCGDADGPKTNGTGVPQIWAGMTTAQRQEYKDAGITVLVSLFGWTAKPTSSKWDPMTTANMMADWVTANGVDGVDVDYEDTVAMDGGIAEAWVISFTTQLRNKLPSPTYILTHAPMAPWFSGSYPGGGYRKIDQAVGGMIDWYNVQFYNAGPEYVDCTSLVQQNDDQTALLQINSEGKVPLNKLVMGKPAANGDGGSYTDITMLSSCIQTAKGAGWGQFHFYG
ncbi:glycoside hydrolase superfamily [Mycena vulgaris]|nr:glycoside hydrolase superfamily [Mycena vulgaris]